MIQFGSHFCPNMGIAHRIFPDFDAQRIVDLHYPGLPGFTGLHLPQVSGAARCAVGLGFPISQSTLLTSFHVVFSCLHSSELCKNTVV